jgi:NADH-quinone oxidoreductase subunit L
MPTLTAIAFLMLGGAIAKSAQLPLQTWLYSAMEAPASVSALLHAATMVKAGVFLIARLFILFGPLILSIPMWLSSLVWIGAITAFIGATLALYSIDIKGVAAFSTISQIGFMMAALGSASPSSSVGWFAGLFHLTNHAFFQGLDFLTIGGIVHAVGSRDMRLMGGLKKVMPITFSFSVIVMLTRTGFPPFASFFSKELIIGSLWSTGSILIATIYAATALTFAYSLRFIILVYLHDPSTYLKKIRLHEPPKIMLFSCGILATMCVCWVLFEGSFATFMHASVEMGMSQIFSLSTLLFVIILFFGSFPVYLTYYRKSPLIEKIRKNVLAVAAPVLEHGYFFDDFYERVIVKGFIKISEEVRRADTIVERAPYLVADKVSEVSNIIQRYIEAGIFDRLPQTIARAVVALADGGHKYFDVLIDELLYVVANRKSASGSKTEKTHNQSLQRSIAAALLGSLILLILAIVKILMVK